MNSAAVPLAVLSALVLASVGLSIALLFQTTSAARTAAGREHALREQLATEVEALRSGLDALAGEVHDLEVPAPVNVLPATPRPGLNLSKRSQVLRMHRRGEAPAQIANVLQIPRQEVELLIKVHRIVVSKV
ncbi:MAG: hypothetical protein C5B51_21160 [Terriglobia bacterium]|nr:MAG: hypothetical protein C5B51_21160 [Terriglobia bacterium]